MMCDLIDVRVWALSKLNTWIRRCYTIKSNCTTMYTIQNVRWMIKWYRWSLSSNDANQSQEEDFFQRTHYSLRQRRHYCERMQQWWWFIWSNCDACLLNGSIADMNFKYNRDFAAMPYIIYLYKLFVFIYIIKNAESS